MKILVYTGYDEATRYKEMGNYSSGNKLLYSQRNNYSFLCERDYSNYARNVSWFKIKRILSLLGEYDYIFWSDADSLILKHETRLEEIIELKGKQTTHVMTPDREEINLSEDGDKWFIASDDEWANLGPCLGGFLIKNHPTARKFLEEIYASTEFEDGPWWDQHAAHKLWKTNPEYLSGLKVVSRVFMNSFADHKQDSFLIHDKFHIENGKVVPKDRQ